MRGFGFLGAFAFLVLLFIAGAIGFGLGQNTVPQVAPPAGTPVVYYGHGGFLGLLMGSVTTYVVNHALCPVVVVRK